MKKKRPLTDKNGEVRELTREEIRDFQPAHEVLPQGVHAMLMGRKRGQRGKQKTPTKRQVTLRLDGDVLDYFRRSGAGWQSRINDLLKAIAHAVPK